jgi:hypothetical protein
MVEIGGIRGPHFVARQESDLPRQLVPRLAEAGVASSAGTTSATPTTGKR